MKILSEYKEEKKFFSRITSINDESFRSSKIIRQSTHQPSHHVVSFSNVIRNNGVLVWFLDHNDPYPCDSGVIDSCVLTLLYWILHVSKDVWESSGYLCFKENNKLSALSARTWFLSFLSVSDIRSFTITHEVFELLMHALRLHVYIEDSTLSASSSASCSEAMLRQSRRYSGENFSEVHM